MNLKKIDRKYVSEEDRFISELHEKFTSDSVKAEVDKNKKIADMRGDDTSWDKK